MRFIIQFSGGVETEAELYANPVATELASRLPMTAAFKDFNRVEKVSALSDPLTVSGVPEQDSPQPGEIGYYAPAQTLVLYYGTVGTWPGLVRVGRFDLDVDTLAALPDGFTAHFAPAEPVA